ncbi:retron St85 family RNA-directed DNA polymerase [Oceaniglobus trochenteri]|uniref:retron St85 family RNA-directed DNA polymerase n=1 Tax=Oceaniglobus trochenteri TaxID=2763260 RepID=UPI001CFFDBAA|nr:retron St85 family RNA-directed DNA polymerase [Oceaniglobus trochenteri]
MLREVLAEKSGISPKRLQFIQENASRMYKVYPISKRDGTDRIISQPTPELKALQRWLSRGIFQRLPVSSCAMAYKKGASIRENAKAHVKTSFTLHLDFEDFFPSFSTDHIIRYLSENTKLNSDDIQFCSDVVCRHGRLTIGAPSSPAVTNALMHSFDLQVDSWCSGRGLVYTRYADDINISSAGSGSLGDVEGFISATAKDFKYASLTINGKKTAYLSKKYRRSITGINVTPEGCISIGRARKREIKSLVHSFKLGSLEPELLWKLGGLIAFAHDVEPDFVVSLKKKYGSATVEAILHQKTPRGLRGPKE